MTETLVTGVVALGLALILSFTILRAWRGWLELRRLEIAQRASSAPADDGVGVRIELAAVRERLKKLEAIASGVDP